MCFDQYRTTENVQLKYVKITPADTPTTIKTSTNPFRRDGVLRTLPLFVDCKPSGLTRTTSLPRSSRLRHRNSESSGLKSTPPELRRNGPRIREGKLRERKVGTSVKNPLSSPDNKVNQNRRGVHPVPDGEERGITEVFDREVRQTVNPLPETPVRLFPSLGQTLYTTHWNRCK